MDDVLFALLAFLLCIVAPIGLVVGLIVWLVRRGQPAAPPLDPAAGLRAAEQLFARWHAAGQLSDATLAQLRDLLAQERAAPAGALPTTGLVAPPAPQPARASALAPAVAASIVADAPSLAPAGPALAAPGLAGAIPAPLPAGPSFGERFGSALVSLRTRQTLLFLGAFLLVVSALILIVFNWASFPPILQFALLAGVCAGFWGGGAWLIRNTDLDRAGAGLQVVGAVLVPVVAFSLSRPGLLDLAPRGGVLLAGLLSLPIYALAAWRLGRPVFSGGAAVSAAVAVLAALTGVPNAWLPLALVLTLASYLPLARLLSARAAALAPGPRWVAQAGVPLGLLVALLPVFDSGPEGPAAAALWAGAGFYLLALVIERKLAWAWAAALLPVPALALTLGSLELPAPWWGLAPALLALAYLDLALVAERRFLAYAPAAYVGAALMVALALPAVLESAATARWALPALALAALALPAAYQRGRLLVLPEPARGVLAALMLGLGAVLLAAWQAALLEPLAMSEGEIGLTLLPLASLYLLGAAFWPGRLRYGYDLALQVVGVGLALLGATLALDMERTWWAALAGLALIWLFQALRYRSALWGALALGCGLGAGAALLDRFAPSAEAWHWAALGLAFAGAYLVGGALLARTRWAYWRWPAAGWGALAGMGALAVVLLDAGFGDERAWHVLAVLALAAVVALAAALWRAWWPGFAVAGLLALATLMAAAQGFFVGWQLARADYAYLACVIAFAFVLLGQGLRRVADRYAWPYELVGYAILTCAPLAAAGDYQHATLTWVAMMLLYGLAVWLYGLRWALAPALLALDMALLSGAGWLLPAGRPEGSALILLGATWLQGLIGLALSRRAPAGGRTAFERLAPAYAAALISGAGALAIAQGATDVLAWVALGLALVLAIVSSAHLFEPGAWGALMLLALGLGALQAFLQVEPLWNMAWGVAEALALALLGWLLTSAARRLPSGISDRLHIWGAPLAYGPLAAGGLLTFALGALAIDAGELPPLTFALATYALVLATLAVRLRATEYAYAAGAALVVAGLCQLYDWGFRQPQLFVIPAGLYLLALAEGLRRFQGQRRLSQVLEAGAVALTLGVSFGQSLRTSGLESQAYAAWLCLEALLMLGYGVLRKLRAPFLGGAGFFVAGVLWLSVDPLMALNKWVLLGLLGLLLVGVYLLLERRQQQLARAGRALIETVSTWK